MNVLGLDWETYYDNDYTLKKLSTTAYIRSPEFQAYGAAVRWNNERTAKWLLLPELKKYLKKVNWKQTALLAHHAHFDGLILTHHFKHKPAYYYDTLSMGRALYGVDTGVSLEKLSQYCGFGSKVEGYLEGVKGERKPSKAALDKLGRGAIRDCNLMWQLFRRMLEDFPEEELDLINYTIKCYTEPVFLVNKQKAQQLHNRVVRKRKALLKKVSGKARFTQKDYEELKTKLSSRTQYPEMLREAGVEPPMKVSPSWLKKPVAERDESKKYTFALAKTDLSFLALLEHPDEDVRNLVEAKLLCSSNIQETRPLRMIEHSDPALTIYLKYWGAKTTGRWSGADKMNPQNLSRDGELRQAILPPKGHKIVIGDSTAIEAVLNAYMAGQHDLLEQFADKELKKKGEDPYTLFASQIYGRKITKKNKTERFVGKVAVLALGYQMGVPKLQFTFETGMLGPRLVLDADTYNRIVDLYRSSMYAIVDQWNTFQTYLRNMMHLGFEEHYKNDIWFKYQQVELPCGLNLNYPKLRYEIAEKTNKTNIVYKDSTHIYGGKLVQNVTEGIARTVIGQQYLRIADKYKLGLIAHDELVLVVPNNKVKQAKQDLLETLSTPLDWCPDAPLGGEVGVFDTYVKM